MSYSMPAGYPGTIRGQQWLAIKGDGSSPVAVPGATGATCAWPSAYVGYWPAVQPFDDTNTYSSPIFATQGVPLGNSGLQTGDPLTSGGAFQSILDFNGLNAPITLYGPSTVRVHDQDHFASGSSALYIDNYLAPGTYAANTGVANFQQATLFAATGGSSSTRIAPYLVGSPAPGKILAQLTAPATAARPAGNTGNGFYVGANGFIYDPMSVEFRPKGADQLHWDSVSPGLPNSGANAVRFWIDPRQTDYNLSKLTNLISHGIVPVICLSFIAAQLTATFDGTNTMHVTAMAAGGKAGRIYVGMSLVTNDGNGSFVPCIVTAFGTGTGLTGTYTLSQVQPAFSGAIKSPDQGLTNSPANAQPAAQAAAVAWLCDIQTQYASIMKYCMLNPTNEWGQQGQDVSLSNKGANAPGSTNTAWRDFWSGATGIPALRTAGYTCPIVIDAPGSGQDGGNYWTLINHGPAVAAADTFGSVIFSAHIYSLTFPGQFAGVAAQFAAVRAAHGIAFIIGEFGQGLKRFDVDGSTTNLEVMKTCDAYCMGWFAWVWDGQYQGSAPTTDNTTYAMVYDYSEGYIDSDSADLTDHGKTVVEHPVSGLLATAVKATAGSFS